MAYFFLFIFIFSATAQAQDCLSDAEIIQTITEFEHGSSLLIPENSSPILFDYKNYNMDIHGYTDFKNSKNKIIVQLLGPKCRQKMLKDELLLLLCHELGHVLGGAPFMNFIGLSSDINVSAEGQADYYATSTCLPYLFSKEDNTPFAKMTDENAKLRALCPQASQVERGLCVRIAMASLDFATYMHGIIDASVGTIPPKSAGPLPEFLVNNSAIVTKTLRREYPSPICRLETLIAGLQHTNRPACWFNTSDP